MSIKNNIWSLQDKNKVTCLFLFSHFSLALHKKEVSKTHFPSQTKQAEAHAGRSMWVLLTLCRSKSNHSQVVVRSCHWILFILASFPGHVSKKDNGKQKTSVHMWSTCCLMSKNKSGKCCAEYFWPQMYLVLVFLCSVLSFFWVICTSGSRGPWGPGPPLPPRNFKIIQLGKF